MFSISKKAIYLGVVLGISILVALYIVSERFEPLTPTRIVRQRQTQRLTRTSSPLVLTQPGPATADSQAKSAAPDASPKIAPSPTASLLEICYSGWKVVAETQAVDLQNDLRKKLTFLSVDCLERMRLQAQPTEIKEFVVNCQQNVSAKAPDFIERVCVPALPRFQAFVVRSLGLTTRDFASLSPTELAQQLAGGMVNLRQASETEIQRNIELANTLIAKDPNFYPAYKAKLINHLIEELKFGRLQESNTYESLYRELLSFTGEDRQDSVLAEADELRGANASSQEISGMDTDLVHIPFLRMAAMNNIEGLTAMAQDYIEAYPNSYVGYMYLADAAWKSGDSAAAVNVFKAALGPNATDAMAYEALRRFQTQNPLDRIILMAPR